MQADRDSAGEDRGGVTWNKLAVLGFFGLLALVFIALKLAEIGPVAAWSWWWVLANVVGTGRSRVGVCDRDRGHHVAREAYDDERRLGN